jgi:hypothetical protein
MRISREHQRSLGLVSLQRPWVQAPVAFFISVTEQAPLPIARMMCAFVTLEQ